MKIALDEYKDEVKNSVSKYNEMSAKHKQLVQDYDNLNKDYNNLKNEKIEIKKDNLNLNLNKEINKERKEPNINIQFKKISMKKIIPNKKIENNNITEIPKNIIKELSRVD